MTLREQIENYIPVNEQEKHDREEMLRQMEDPSIYTRENRSAHLTASAWVVNRQHTKVLMAWHNIYQSWSWLGGHVDGERDLLGVAVREVKEESGLQNVTPMSEDIFSLEILTVDGHEKRGSYVSSHLHLNVTYLLEADEEESLREKPDENSGVAWFAPEDALNASTEDWFKERIYPKLIEKFVATYGQNGRKSLQ